MNQPPQQPGWGQPQQPGPPQPGWAPPPPRKSSAGKIIGIIAAAAIGFFVVLGGCVALVASNSDTSTNSGGSDSSAADDGDKSTTKDDAPAEKKKAPRGAKWAAKGADTSDAGWEDVELTSCEAGEFGYPKADVKITNRSSDTSNYAVDLEFVDASGKRLAEGIVATNNLASGQSTTEEAGGLSEVSGEFECKFTKVMRYAS